MHPGKIEITVDTDGRVHDGACRFLGKIFQQDVRAAIVKLRTVPWFEAITPADISLGWYPNSYMAMLALAVGVALPGAQDAPG